MLGWARLPRKFWCPPCGLPCNLFWRPMPCWPVPHAYTTLHQPVGCLHTPPTSTGSLKCRNSQVCWKKSFRTVTFRARWQESQSHEYNPYSPIDFNSPSGRLPSSQLVSHKHGPGSRWAWGPPPTLCPPPLISQHTLPSRGSTFPTVPRYACLSCLTSLFLVLAKSSTSVADFFPD